MSADQGNALGQNSYGLCLENGEGVAKNLSEAARYYKMSADHGDERAAERYRLCLQELSAKKSNKDTSLSSSIMNLDEFKNVRELGRGQFGVVYLCQNKAKESLAVKYIEVGPKFDSARLLQEVAVLKSLTHPCIVRIVGWALPNKECEKARIATEFISNGSLEDVLSRVKRGEIPSFWTHTNVTKMMIGLVLGMKYLHSQNIIHRDLKPGNLLLDEKGRIRIADFGTAKLEDCGTVTTEIIGTLAYMPCEILSRGPPTKKVDVFGFGLILYEVLFGESVFPKDANPVEVAAMHLQNVRPTIPEGTSRVVAKVIEKCWSKDPGDRPTFDEIFSFLAENWFPFFKDTDYSECERFIDEVMAEEARNGK
jgi:serine/threonine protein kinase